MIKVTDRMADAWLKTIPFLQEASPKKYAQAILDTLLEEHEKEQEDIENETIKKSVDIGNALLEEVITTVDEEYSDIPSSYILYSIFLSIAENLVSSEGYNVDDLVDELYDHLTSIEDAKYEENLNVNEGATSNRCENCSCGDNS